MKKIAVLFLITVVYITMLSGCGNKKSGGIDEHNFPDADYDITASDIAVAGDSIYYIAQGGVYKTGEERTAFELDHNAEYIASDGMSLYAFGGGKVTHGDDIYTLPQSEITSFVCADGTLCWTYNENGDTKIGFYNLKNGDMIAQKPLFGVDCKVIPYTGSKIIVHCFDLDGYMALYDFDTASMKTGGIMISSLSIFNAAYNAADNAIYMLDGNAMGNNMSRYDIATGETTHLIPCDDLSLEVENLLFSGGSAIIQKFDGEVKVRNEYTLPDDGITTVTAIITPDNGALAGEELIKLTEGLRKNYNIELVIIEYNDRDKLRQKQLAGDGDYDLYFASESGLILDYPIYEPLDTYPQIMEQFDGMLDDIKRLCSYDGKVFGAPFIVSTLNTVKGYNAELLERLDIALPPADWTLDDYYELALELSRHDCYISFRQPLWLSDYAAQFFDPDGTGTVNDDGTVLRKLLEINKKLKKEGLLYDGEFTDNSENVLFNNPLSSHAFVYNRADVWFNPTFNGERCYSDQFAVLMMNIHSQNKDAAATVIAEFMKPGGSFTNPLRGMLYYRDMSVYEVPWLPPNFEEFYADAPEQRDEAYAYFEARRAELETNDLSDMDEKTAYNYSLYLDCLSYMKPGGTYTEWRIFAKEQAEKYENDEQDLDYAVELIYNRAKLMLEE